MSEKCVHVDILCLLCWSKRPFVLALASCLTERTV